MALFNDSLMLLAMEPTRYLSIRDCANLERVSHSASDVAWLCYPVVADLSAFGITDQMTHNAFSDLPRHCTAFFRRFDCNKLTSLRVPWKPQTVVIKNGISYSDAGKLLEKCPNLVELPPIEAKFEESTGLDNLLSGAQKRSLQSVTLYSDMSHYERNELLTCYPSETRVSSTSVCRLEIAVKIPFNMYEVIDAALGAFIRLISLHFDIPAVKSLKIFFASNLHCKDQSYLYYPQQRQIYMDLPGMFQGWTALEELSITIEHSTTGVVLFGPSDKTKVNFDVFPSLRTFSIIPLYCAPDCVSDSEFVKFYIEDRGALACMSVLQHLNIGSFSYCLQEQGVRAYDVLSVKRAKERLERVILILNENKIERVRVGHLSKEVSTPEILAHIGESGCLREFGMLNMSISTDSLLNIFKRNKDLEVIIVLHCRGIGDELFTLLAQAQLRNVSGILISSCSPTCIERYIKWRMQQIENGHDLAHVKLTNNLGEDVIATVLNVKMFPNMKTEEVLEKGRIITMRKK